MGYLTGNAFNWTTLYKLNHDEYEETEETTFSYPAKILPPSPQNIAKTIVINTDLKINMTANNIPLTILKRYEGGGVKNTEEWFNNNQPIISSKNINLKDYLDPTLLINTFNDLKRYYKSITIYYDYDIETKEEVQNASGYHDRTWVETKFFTTESFNPAKEIKNTSITIELKDLIFEKYKTNIIEKEYSWSQNIDWSALYDKRDGNLTGKSYTYYKINSNYSINNYEITLKDNGNREGFDLLFNNKTSINFFIQDNNNLNWEIYLLSALSKIEAKGQIIGSVHDNGYAMRYINIIKANFNKIVLNAR
ncbi:hypothetical protein [Spiroplasma endosymbiont of Amphimallon solstitiale]|uniref:hypothetical protein n=1 Tax=Spiroplasma endosymbiont of Amphimallon solstitiale TaxID=3066288 RepID=UPI00313C6B8A